MEHRCSGAGGGEQDGDADNAHAHAAVDAAAAATDQNCSEQGEQGGEEEGQGLFFVTFYSHNNLVFILAVRRWDPLTSSIR